MGLVVDFQQTRPSFRNPRQTSVFNVASNTFRCVMHSFDLYFPFRYVAGQGLPPPSTRELWQIGVVQNVIFERAHFEYEDGATFTQEFPDPVLDTVARISRPFYSDRVTLPPQELTNPNTMQRRILGLDFMVPSRDIWYTSAGFGELLDPWHTSGVSLITGTLEVNILDEPTFGARLRRGVALVTRAERILAFKAWLIAKSPSAIHVLAHVQPFSLVFWMTTRPNPGRLSGVYGRDMLSVPAHDSDFYGQHGITHRVTRSPQRGTPQIRIQPGSGGRRPVLEGQTANERIRTWARGNGLLP